MRERIQIREWERLVWYDPERLLRKLREAEIELAPLDLPPDLKHLRSRELSPFNEARQAALFAYGISQVLGPTVRVAMHEDGDYDCVVAHVGGGARRFIPIQLKEWVPPELNSTESLNALLVKISRKYPSATDTTVAIHVNRAVRVEYSALEIPSLHLGGLWLFGAADPNQTQWFLYGSLLHEPRAYNYAYPWP